jgi:hypothetical protein
MLVKEDKGYFVSNVGTYFSDWLLQQLHYEVDNGVGKWRKGEQIFRFSKTSRPDLGLIQPPSSMVSGAPSRVKAAGK